MCDKYYSLDLKSIIEINHPISLYDFVCLKKNHCMILLDPTPISMDRFEVEEGPKARMIGKY